MAGYEFPVKTHHKGGPIHNVNSSVSGGIEMQLLEQILSLDMALYNYARDLAQRWSERLNVPLIAQEGSGMSGSSRRRR